MTLRASLLDEPLLEFGGNGREIDIRLGLMRHGPLEPDRASRVRLGVIGTADTIQGFERFLDRCRAGIDAKACRQPNLFLRFPGLGNENPFRCVFEVDPHARRTLPRSDIANIVSIASSTKAIEEAVALFASQAQAIAESPGAPDVIVCALPHDLINRIVHETSVIPDADDEGDEDDEPTHLNFRDLLKARTILDRYKSHGRRLGRTQIRLSANLKRFLADWCRTRRPVHGICSTRSTTRRDMSLGASPATPRSSKRHMSASVFIGTSPAKGC